MRDITEGLRVKDDEKAKDKRDPFTHEQLRKLFSDTEMLHYRKLKHKAYNYWIPMVALCAGGRLSELLYLTLADIKEEKGVTYITIETHDDRGIKTGAIEASISCFSIQ